LRCGAASPQDVAALSGESEAGAWADAATVDNETFALLRAGSDAGDAIAVVCGAGINCVGRGRDGRIARYPGLGWETGDWGGGEELGREALFLAVRGEDGRGRSTALTELVRTHFDLPSAVAVGEAVHYRRLRATRLGEIAPRVVELAAAGDAVARELADARPSLLGCPAGRSLLSTYRALAGSSLDATIVMMDEYVPVPPPGAHHSCRGFALREIAAALGLPAEQVWLPDPDDPAA